MDKESMFNAGAIYLPGKTHWCCRVWNISMRYGNKLREKRNSRSLSQEQLAKALELANHQIADLENERACVDIDKLRRLSRYFQVNILDWMPDCSGTQKKELDIGGNTEKYKSFWCVIQ